MLLYAKYMAKKLCELHDDAVVEVRVRRAGSKPVYTQKT